MISGKITYHQFRKGWASLLLLFIFVGLYSCKNATLEPDNAAVGYGYFPVEKGQFWVYKVDEQIVRFQQGTERKGYLIKELVGDTFTDPRGEVSYRLYRYSHPDTTPRTTYTGLSWQLDSLWSIRRGANSAVRTENNNALVKFTFPLREGLSFNPNQYNLFGSQTFRVRDYNRSVTIRGRRYDRTLRVVQSSDFNCLGQDNRSEHYADGVGLIFKSSAVYAFDPDSCLNRIIQGRAFTQTLLESGKE